MWGSHKVPLVASWYPILAGLMFPKLARADQRIKAHLGSSLSKLPRLVYEKVPTTYTHTCVTVCIIEQLLRLIEITAQVLDVSQPLPNSRAAWFFDTL